MLVTAVRKDREARDRPSSSLPLTVELHDDHEYLLNLPRRLRSLPAHMNATTEDSYR